MLSCLQNRGLLGSPITMKIKNGTTEKNILEGNQNGTSFTLFESSRIYKLYPDGDQWGCLV